jgi:hypothetical protein
MARHPKPFMRVNSLFMAIAGPAAIAAVALILWQLAPEIHAYVVAAGAALATFLAPLPAILSPTAKRRWDFVILISAMVGICVWFGAENMASEAALEHNRRTLQHGALTAAILGLPEASRGPIMLSLAQTMKRTFHAQQFESVLDLTDIIRTVDADNGHALYYAGEAYRRIHNRTDLREALQHYLAEAGRQRDALDGDAARCYERPHGYCAERTAWVNHLMANDYLDEAGAPFRSIDRDALLTSFRYEHHVLQIRPLGFYRLGTIRSSCDVISLIRPKLHGTAVSAEIERDAQSLRCP